jgi:hypothetical protein
MNEETAGYPPSELCKGLQSRTDDTEVFSWVFLLKKLSDERLSISNPLAVCNGLARKGVTHLVPCRFSLHMSMFCTLWWATLCQLEDMLSRLLLGSSNIISSENGLASEAECFVIDWVLLTIYVAHSIFAWSISLSQFLLGTRSRLSP